MSLNNLKSNLELICGANSVYSLLKTNIGKRKIYEIYLSNSRQSIPKIKEILILAKEKRIQMNVLEDKKFEKLFDDSQIKTQGICARVSNYTYYDFDLFLSKEANKNSRLVILDNITDVGNFGAIIRSAFAFNFDGIIIPKNRSVEVNKDVNRTSAGMLEEVKIFQVSNLIRYIKLLKNKGFWIYGTDIENDINVKSIDELDFTFPMALILGSEHKGISRLAKENSDFLFKIDINKKLDSINVSVAAGIIFYEIDKRYKKA